MFWASRDLVRPRVGGPHPPVGSISVTACLGTPVGSNRSISSRAPTRSAGPASPERGGQPGDDLVGADPAFGQLGQRDGAVPLGEPFAVGPEHERHMQVLGRRQAEEPLEQDLARRRRQQVVTAHHLGHPLCGVVDDNCQVVGGHTVPPLQHDVVDRSAVDAREEVDELDLLVLGAQPQGGRSPDRLRAPHAPLG